jgi:hypothetical protein
MFDLSAICWAIWKCQNRICFEKKVIKNPSVILFSACSLMRYWTGLHSVEAQEVINSRVDLLAKTIVKILGRMKDARSTPALTGANHEDAEGDGSGA